MRILKRLIVTLFCAILTKISYAQIPNDTITMYTKNIVLYNILVLGPDTLLGYNNSGRFEEQALILTDQYDKQFDILSMCRNRTTPNAVKLVRIGKNLFCINQRYVVKINDSTLYAFTKSFDEPRHCDHYSHYSSR